MINYERIWFTSKTFLSSPNRRFKDIPVLQLRKYLANATTAEQELVDYLSSLLRTIWVLRTLDIVKIQ